MALAPADRERAVTIMSQIIAAKVPDESPDVIRATAETLVDAADQVRDGKGGTPEPGDDSG